MSGAFYHYKQRCEELERALASMTMERDHYFNEAEHFRCELLDTLAAQKEEESIEEDPMVALMGKALSGLHEVTLSEAIAAAGIHEPSNAVAVRVGICLRKLGWQRHKIRNAHAKYVFRRAPVIGSAA